MEDVEPAEATSSVNSAPAFVRNDAISPVAVLVLVIIFVYQSPLVPTLFHHQSSHKSVVARLTRPASADFFKQLITLDLLSKAAVVLKSVKPGDPLFRVAGTRVHEDVIANAEKLLRDNPTEPSAARRLILLRAEVAGTFPLAPLEVTKGSPSCDPLSTYVKAMSAYPDAGASLSRESELWLKLFSRPVLTRTDEQQVLRTLPSIKMTGFFRRIAEHQIYMRANDTPRTQASLNGLVGYSRDYLIPLFGVELLAVLLAIIGVLLIVLFVIEAQSRSSLPSILAAVPLRILPEQRRLGAGDLANVFVLYFAVMALVGVLAPGIIGIVRAAGFRVTTNQEGLAFAIAASTVVELVVGFAAIGVLVLIARRRGANLGDELGLTLKGVGKNILFAVCGYAVMLPVIITAAMIAGKLFHNAPAPENPALGLLAESPHGLFGAVLFILVAILAPVLEEVMFRGVFLQAALLRIGYWPAILLSGLMFGLAHPVGVAEALTIGALGCVLAWITLRRRSLVPNMIVHGIQNSSVFLVMWLALAHIAP